MSEVSKPHDMPDNFWLRGSFLKRFWVALAILLGAWGIGSLLAAWIR